MLLKDEQIRTVDSVVQPTQIIAAALIGSVLLFSLVCLMYVGTDSLTTKVDVITLVGIVIGVVAIVKSIFLPDLIAAGGVKAAEQEFGNDTNGLVENLSRVFQTKKILQMALLEGAAFANLTFLFLSHSLVPLIVVAIALAGLALAFPRRQAAYDWVLSQLEK